MSETIATPMTAAPYQRVDWPAYVPRPLVMGATGFIGSHVAALLVQRGDEVHVTVRDGSRQETLAGLPPFYAPADSCVRRWNSNVVGVQDVARGHLLADERGAVGERYILGNRNFTLDRLFADLGRLSGVEPPAVKLPLYAALAWRPRASGSPARLSRARPRCGRRRSTGRSSTARPSASQGGRPRRTRTASRRRWPITASATGIGSPRRRSSAARAQAGRRDAPAPRRLDDLARRRRPPVGVGASTSRPRPRARSGSPPARS